MPTRYYNISHGPQRTIHLPPLILFLTIITILPLPTTAEDHPPRGVIHPLLHTQALSHFALHSRALRLALAAPFTPPRTAAIVGVEWGTDVIQLADASYRVFAVEPVAKYITHLQSLARHRHPSWDLHLIPVAAGNATDAQHDQTKRLDDIIDEPLAVLSVDVQGDEAAVLHGSTRLLHKHVASVWVEAIACNDARVRDVLHTLDQHYTLFDFVPWGMPNVRNDTNDAPSSVPRGRDSFVWEPQRPGDFDAYLKWMCAVASERFQWLQTDFLAVRRSLIHAVWNRLETVANETCAQADADCVLRKFVLDNSVSGDTREETPHKDEL